MAKHRKKPKGRRADGMRYERKAQSHLMEQFQRTYAPGPWFKFWVRMRSTGLWCQPDGLIFDRKRRLIVIVECKLRHTSDAWWQVRKLYEPVVRKVFGAKWQYAMLEVVCWFDPDTPFPEEFDLIRNIAHPIRPDSFAVYIHNGRAHTASPQALRAAAEGV